ncbi:hypothetical protein BVX97_04165 [bacterium E08(2017)]|nr:hypothetical protein BVX97_04165 [bacterium E08(2017)]
MQDAQEKKVFNLRDGVNTIGRDGDCDIQILEEKASRKHAEITVTGNDATIQDLKSANGTLVDGKSISHSHLKQGNEITIADRTLLFEVLETDKTETQSFVPKVKSDRSYYATIKQKPVAGKQPRNTLPGQSGDGAPGLFKKIFKGR